MKLAAIDVGSNAARLLIVEVVVNDFGVAEFNKLEFVRLPLRLGFDVFEKGKISEEKAHKFVTAMQLFKHFLSYYEVTHLKACATSAMRDALNSKEMVERIQREVGITLQVITGDEEALLMNENLIAENSDKEKSYVYVNVGGGSTDLVFFTEGKVHYKKSINIGTIRLLKNLVSEADWKAFKSELKSHVKSRLPTIAVGSGGNINKLFSISKKKEGRPLSLELLKHYYAELSSLTIEERIDLYKLRDDRADVIVPALQIFINLMRWTSIKEIYVPKIGLADGLVRALYREIKNKSLKEP